jgi:hypothetical protein
MTDTVASPIAFAAENDFRVGRVFNRTASVFSRNFLPFFLVTAVAYLPTLALTKLTADGAASSLAIVGVAIGAALLTLVLSMISQAVVLYGAFQDMRGRPVSLTESLQVGLRRFLPIVGLAIAMGLLVALAAILLVFPAFILLTMWFVATPACVVEQLGPSDSMRRSTALTKGHRWKIFGLMLVLLIISAAVSPAIDAAMTAIGGTTLVFVGGLIWNGIWGAFYAIAVVVTYHDLRVAKEGVDIEQIAAVFE